MSEAATSFAGLIAERRGSLGRLRLDRPKALNALNLSMVQGMEQALDGFEADPAIAAVLISGEGERGLCAGGDIRAIYGMPRVRDGEAALFWREEYRLIARMARFPKPIVTLMDGITMGGGVGVSAHAAHRIVTETSRIAMPEVTIGFVPDVGGSCLLGRAPGELGTYLALTGLSIGAADAVALGLADVEIASASIAALIDDLTHLAPGSDPRAVIARYAVASAEPALSGDRASIDRAFAHDGVEAILAALSAEATPFALETRDLIASKSPTSLKLTLRLMRLGRADPRLEACLEREFAAATATTVGPDFYEGVRAAVVDKDRNPKWSPATLAEVDDALIAAGVRPVADRVFPAID